MDDIPEELLARCVRPYYLVMMGTGAIDGPVPYRDIGEAGGETTDDEVRTLLASHWRPRVAGAWLAAGRKSTPIRDALLRSMESSQGLLTSPPLATVAVLNAGEAAVPALRHYLDAHIANDWGEPGFVVAAVESVGGTVPGCAATDGDHSAFASMLIVAQRLAALRREV